MSARFVKVLAMAAETGMIRQVGGVSVGGTKIKALHPATQNTTPSQCSAHPSLTHTLSSKTGTLSHL